MTPLVRDRLALALVSAGWLLFQITLTRVLSVVVWYHFAFLAVALAMLGAAAPGVWFALRPATRAPAGFLVSAGVLPAVATVILLRWGAASLGFAPVMVSLVTLPPMIAFGASVILILGRAADTEVPRLYAADLVGAGLAAAVVVPLLSWIPTPQLVALSGILPLIGAFLLGARLPSAVLGGLLLAATLAPGPWTVVRSKVYDERVSPPLHEVWTPTARIAVFGENFFFLEGHDHGFTWGKGKYFDAPDSVRQVWVEQDGSAGTPITAFDGNPASVGFLLYDVSTLGLQLRDPVSVCVIGAGGGRDVLSALAVGADSVVAVDVVGATLRLVQEEFGAFSGHLYARPGVIPVEAEGRAFLAGTPLRFDAIQVSMTDSWAATGAGAYALSENGLYTVEAFRLYLDRLTDDGVVSVARWTKELPWLIAVATEALRQSGIESPEQHVAVQRAGRLAALVVSRRPLDDADHRRLFDVALDRGFYPWYPVPARRQAVNPRVVTWVEEGVASLEDTGALMSPATDDRPFFFQPLNPFANIDAQYEALRDRTGESVVTAPTRALRQALLSTAVLAALLLLVPAAWLGRSGVDRGELVRGTLFFAMVGFGFVLVETVLLQRLALFLGHPTRALTVVLAGVLVGMGVGSLASARLGAGTLRRWGWATCLAVGGLAVTLQRLSGDGLGWPLWLRIAGVAVGTLGLGALLGGWFPLGVRRFRGSRIPWWWAANGFAGVVGAVLAVALSIRFGFAATLTVAASAYAVAWLLTLNSDPRSS